MIHEIGRPVPGAWKTVEQVLAQRKQLRQSHDGKKVRLRMLQPDLEPAGIESAHADLAEVAHLARVEVGGVHHVAQKMRPRPAPERIDGYYRDLFVLAYPIHRPKSGGVANWPAKTLEQKLPFTGPNAFFLMNSAPKTDLLFAEETDRAGEEDTTLAEVVDVTPHLSPDGHLRWTPPPGDWQILRFGCTLADVCKNTVWLNDARDLGAFNRIYMSYFGQNKPARSTTEARLMVDAKVEIDVVAYKP